MFQSMRSTMAIAKSHVASDLVTNPAIVTRKVGYDLPGWQKL